MDNALVKINATVSFPSLTRPDAMSGKYCVQLANLSDAAVEKLEEMGVNVKFKDDSYGRGKFIECKSAYPIDNSKFTTVVDEQGLPMDADAVGPGSKVTTTVKTYEWSAPGGRSGVSARLVKMVVTELAKNEGLTEVDDNLEAL